MAAPTPAELIELWKPIPKRRWWDTPGAVNVRDYPWDHYLGNNAGNWDTYCDWAEDTGHAEGYLYDCQASRRAFWGRAVRVVAVDLRRVPRVVGEHWLAAPRGV